MTAINAVKTCVPSDLVLDLPDEQGHLVPAYVIVMPPAAAGTSRHHGGVAATASSTLLQ